MTPPDLQDGETLLESWRVSARTFFIRAAVIVAIWVVLGQIASLGQGARITLMALPGAAVIGVFYMWVFGELDVWRHNRDTDWHLTDRALHILPADDLPARLPLTEIRSITRWALWSLVIRLNDGIAITLPIPPHPRQLRDRIAAARDAARPGVPA